MKKNFLTFEEKVAEVRSALQEEVPDFVRAVLPLFEKNEWQWSVLRDGKYVFAIPSVDEMEDTLHGLILDACLELKSATDYSQNNFAIISTGCLEVCIYVHKKNISGALRVVPHHSPVSI